MITTSTEGWPALVDAVFKNQRASSPAIAETASDKWSADLEQSQANGDVGVIWYLAGQ